MTGVVFTVVKARARSIFRVSILIFAPTDKLSLTLKKHKKIDLSFLEIKQPKHIFLGHFPT